jgi:hypothetical protein
VKGASDAVLQAAELAQIPAKNLRHSRVRQTFDIAPSALPLPPALVVIVDPQCVIAVKGDDEAL